MINSTQNLGLNSSREYPNLPQVCNLVESYEAEGGWCSGSEGGSQSKYHPLPLSPQLPSPSASSIYSTPYSFTSPNSPWRWPHHPRHPLSCSLPLPFLHSPLTCPSPSPTSQAIANLLRVLLLYLSLLHLHHPRQPLSCWLHTQALHHFDSLSHNLLPSIVTAPSVLSLSPSSEVVKLIHVRAMCALG